MLIHVTDKIRKIGGYLQQIILRQIEDQMKQRQSKIWFLTVILLVTELTAETSRPIRSLFCFSQ